MMTQPTMMYTQPIMRPPNPFGPVPGAQVCSVRFALMSCTRCSAAIYQGDHRRIYHYFILLIVVIRRKIYTVGYKIMNPPAAEINNQQLEIGK